jgi:hypothetical protein
MGNQIDSARTGYKLHSILQNMGYSSFFFTEVDEADRFYSKKGISNFVNINSLARNVNINTDSINSTIHDVQEKFGISNIYQFIFPAKVRTGASDRRLINTACRYLIGIDEFMSKELKAKLFLANPGGDLGKRACYYAARKHVDEALFIVPSPFPGRIAYFGDESGVWADLRKSTNEDFSHKVKESVARYIRKFRYEKAVMWGDNKLIREHPIYFRDSFRQKMNHAKGILKASISGSRNKSVKKGIIHLVFDFLGNYLKAKYISRYYMKANSDESYILFPLHWSSESTMTIRGYPYYSQEYLAEVIAASLPFGYKLYVKEHPRHRGSISLRCIHKISSLPRTKLVSPLTNSHYLIENARAVAVINSTMGFEALLYGKPVVAFGDSFYTGRGLTYDVKNLYDLPKILSEAVQKPGPSESDIFEFVCSAWSATEVGGLIKIPSRTNDEQIEQLEMLCKSIIKRIKN